MSQDLDCGKLPANMCRCVPKKINTIGLQKSAKQNLNILEFKTVNFKSNYEHAVRSKYACE